MFTSSKYDYIFYNYCLACRISIKLQREYEHLLEKLLCRIEIFQYESIKRCIMLSVLSYPYAVIRNKYISNIRQNI